MNWISNRGSVRDLHCSYKGKQRLKRMWDEQSSMLEDAFLIQFVEGLVMCYLKTDCDL